MSKFLPIKIALEKIPSYEYINRLILYLRSPKIGTESIDNNPLRFAIADMILSLIFAGALITMITYSFPNSIHVNLIKIINPFYVTLAYFTYAFCFSSATALILSIIAKFFKKNSVADFFSLSFLHCVRFYAFITPVTGLIFLYGINEIFKKGAEFYFTDVTIIVIGWVLLILMIYLLFRLLINPLSAFCKFHKKKFAAHFITIVIVMLAFELNTIIPLNISALLIDRKEFCIQISNSPFVKSFCKEAQDKITVDSCMNIFKYIDEKR